MNKRIKIIAVLIVAFLIVFAVWKKFGKGWGIGVAIPMIIIVWFGMSFSLAGPNNWDYLFGTNLPSKDPKQNLAV